MKLSTHQDNFKLFPYQSDYTDGRTNNGGINLLTEPERIDEIKEAKNFPELYEFISESCLTRSPYFTLDCDSDVDESGVYMCYVEFSFKDEALLYNIEFNSEVDVKFNVWIETQNPEMAQAVCKALRWEYSLYAYHETTDNVKIECVLYGASCFKFCETFF